MWIASSNKLGDICVQNSNGDVLLTARHARHPRIVNSVCFLPGSNGLMVASAQQRGVVGITDFSRGGGGDAGITTQVLPTEGGHKASESVTAICTTSSTSLFTTSTDRTARGFDLRSNTWTHTYPLLAHGYSVATDNADCGGGGGGSWSVAVGDKAGYVYFIDLRKSLMKRVKPHQYGVTCMDYKSGVLATGSSDRTCQILQREADDTVLPGCRHLLGHRKDDRFDDGLSGVALSPDHSSCVVTSYDQTVRVYDLAYQEKRRAQYFTYWTDLPRDLEAPITKFLW